MYVRFNPEARWKDIAASFCDCISGSETRSSETLITQIVDMHEMRKALLFDSARDALAHALVQLEIGRVGVPAFICRSVVDAVHAAGGEAVFYDLKSGSVEPDYGSIHADKVDALILAHYCGIPCDFQAALDFTSLHGLLLIEDCASGFGATVGKRLCGSASQIALLSFEESKVLAAFGGGALIVGDALENRFCKDNEIKGRFPSALVRALAIKMALLGLVYEYVSLPLFRRFPIAESRVVQTDSNIRSGCSNLALRMFARLRSTLDARCRVAEAYDSKLQNCSGLERFVYPETATPAYTHYPLRVDPDKRSAIVSMLAQRNVDCGRNYPWLSQLNGREEEFPVAYAYSQSVMTLPICSSYRVRDIEKITMAVQEVLEGV